MKLKYTLKRKAILNFENYMEAIRSCDEGCEGMKAIITEAGKIEFGIPGYLICWLLSRFVSRKITNKYVEYNFYLIL